MQCLLEKLLSNNKLCANMRALIAMGLVTILPACDRHAEPNPQHPLRTPAAQKPMTTHHPELDFDKWANVFPIETFERTDGPRQFDTTKPGDPLDLWKPRGTMITSPAHLCQIELVRKRYAKEHDLGEPVPVDIFLWRTTPPDKPYLTKLGGVPHREASKPWPKDSQENPYTFVAQFCFADSKDIVSDRLPDDVMLIFFKDAGSIYESADIHVEWSSLALDSPIIAANCPKPSFTVPQLSGVIYRCNEYPDSWDVFEKEGHYQYYLFPSTQSTKIGRETYFIQHDVRDDGEELLCALNSIHPSKQTWPFLDLEQLPDDWDKPEDHYEWGKYRMMFADVGCIYFVIDTKGKVTWAMDSY